MNRHKNLVRPRCRLCCNFLRNPFWSSILIVKYVNAFSFFSSNSSSSCKLYESTSWNMKKTSLKGFSASKCDVGIWYFQNLRNFLEIFWIFWGIFLEFFKRIFFGGIILEKFFGRIFWEELFGRNFLVEINKELMFLSRFWGNFVRKEGQEFRSLEVRGKLIALKNGQLF